MNVLSATAASDWCGGMEAGRKARSLMLGTGGEAAARIVDRHLAAGDHQRPARIATLRSARRSHTVTHKQRLWVTGPRHKPGEMRRPVIAQATTWRDHSNMATAAEYAEFGAREAERPHAGHVPG